jgi:hypothetical protein
MAQVVVMCRTLFGSEFTEEDAIAVNALVNRRNEELHSGAAAFDAYTPQQWLPGCYKACQSLCTVLGESLDTLFRKSEAKEATAMLKEIQNEVKGKVLGAIAAHKKVFEAKASKDREAAEKDAEEKVSRLVHDRHHRVKCPSCSSPATVQGKAFGPKHVTNREDEIQIKQSVAPRSFKCSACGLALEGYAELHAANLGGHYTRITTTSPEDFYGLVDLDTVDMQQLLGDFIDRNPEFLDEQIEQRYGPEYDNE